MKLIRLGEAPASSPSLILLTDSEPLISTAENWGRSFGETFTLYILASGLPAPEQVGCYVAELTSQIEDEGIKRATVFGVGSGAPVALELAVQTQRVIRRLLLLDACSRIVPTKAERLLDRLETKLPLGLPFRSLSTHYDARPNLHLVRCPTLVMTSPHCDPFTREQGDLLGSRIPNAWRCSLRERPLGDTPSDELLDILDDFLQVPVKRPQKAASDSKNLSTPQQ